MPPVETTSMPPPSSEEGRKRSITDLKVVEKAMEIPAVSDTYNVLASAIRLAGERWGATGDLLKVGAMETTEGGRPPHIFLKRDSEMMHFQAPKSQLLKIIVNR